MKFIKALTKPVEVRALRFDGTVKSANEIIGWTVATDIGSAHWRCSNDPIDIKHQCSPETPHDLRLLTVAGWLTIPPGSYVVKGAEGFVPFTPEQWAECFEVQP